MSESDWLTSADPTAMLAFLREWGASDRKLRLFGGGCCRRIWDKLPDERCQLSVEVGERFADDAAGEDELGQAYEGANAVFIEFDDRDGRETAARVAALVSGMGPVWECVRDAAAEAALVF